MPYRTMAKVDEVIISGFRCWLSRHSRVTASSFIH